MTRLHRIKATLFLTLLATVSLARADEPQYTLHLHRPVAVGDKFIVDIQEHDTQTVTSQSKRPQVPSTTTELFAHVRGALQITAIDKVDRETAFHLTVDTLQFGDPALPRSVADRGTEIDAVYGDRKIDFTTKSGVLSGAAQQALNMLFTPRPENYFDTNDSIFNDVRPKRIGDTWTANAARFINVLSLMGITVQPEKIHSLCTLKSLQRLNDKPALEFTGHVELAEASVPANPKITKAQQSVDLWGLFPIDNKDSSYKTTMKSKVVFVNADDSPADQKSIEILRRQEESRTLIK